MDSVITNFNTYLDHGMISLVFKDFEEEEFIYGPGYLKCNISTLDSNEFCEELKYIWSQLENCEIKDGCWWETCKVEFKRLIILHSRKISLQYHQSIQQIEAKLCHYYILNHRNPGQFTMAIDSLYQTLKELITDHLSGSKICAKIQHLENDDQRSRFFLRKEIQKGNRKSLKSLLIGNKTLTRSSDITDAAREVIYKSLYSCEDIDPELAKQFLTGLPKLSKDEQSLCEGKLNYEDCYTAIKQMKNRKCPGSDGLPKEFLFKNSFLYSAKVLFVWLIRVSLLGD